MMTWTGGVRTRTHAGPRAGEVSHEHRRDPGASPSPGRSQRGPGQRADPDQAADHPRDRGRRLLDVRRRLLRPRQYPRHRRGRRDRPGAADRGVRPESPRGRPGRRDQSRRAARPVGAAPAVAAVAPAARVHDGVRGGGRSRRARVRRVPADGVAEARAGRRDRGREQHRPAQPGRRRIRRESRRGAVRAVRGQPGPSGTAPSGAAPSPAAPSQSPSPAPPRRPARTRCAR